MKFTSLLLIASVLFALITGCKKNDGPGSPCNQPYREENDADVQNAMTLKFGTDVPAKWWALAINLSRTTANQNAGPIIARTFGYMGITLYESVVPGMPHYQSIQKQLNGLPALPRVVCGDDYFYPAAANAALANMVHHMFGNTSAVQNTTIDSLANAIGNTFQQLIPKYVYDRSVSFGQSVSNAIYNWSLTDGGDKAYLNPYPTTYTPPAGPGLWVPQPSQLAQLPYWGTNRTFIKSNASNTEPVQSPPAYSTDPASEFYKEELEVYKESINQDPEHRAIALYWAALPPPCVSLSILSSVLEAQNSKLSVAAEAYCRVGMASSDAMVDCYRTKYIHNQERPVSFIRANFSAAWAPLLPTPPFPDFTSAHSVQTGACARVLADIFGNDTHFTDNSINNLGFAPRSFSKFSDYANEVGLSRIYGGIHLRSSDFIGLDQGDVIGTHISAIRFKKD